MEQDGDAKSTLNEIGRQSTVPHVLNSCCNESKAQLANDNVDFGENLKGARYEPTVLKRYVHIKWTPIERSIYIATVCPFKQA